MARLCMASVSRFNVITLVYNGTCQPVLNTVVIGIIIETLELYVEAMSIWD